MKHIGLKPYLPRGGHHVNGSESQRVCSEAWKHWGQNDVSISKSGGEPVHFLSSLQVFDLQGFNAFWLSECAEFCSSSLQWHSRAKERARRFDVSSCDPRPKVSMLSCLVVRARFWMRLTRNCLVSFGQSAVSTNSTWGANFIPLAHVCWRYHSEEHFLLQS